VSGAPVPEAPVLITGGAGFVGTNLAHRLLLGGERVILLDNLSRRSVARNLEFLRGRHGDRLDARIADVRDPLAVRGAVRDASFVFHFAAQVAVTRSVEDPIHDFEVNARGTLHVLEALRAQSAPPPLLLTSTNKVYGPLGDLRLARRATRYEPEDERIRLHGLSESRPLDLHSPYACSKGAADQYVLDYARTFGLPAVVLRMSCIYGPRQLGSEDQGWIAHFLIRALRQESITLYGDGLQVRDVLFASDLCDALLAARREIQRLSGRAFNVGGGPANTLSLLELLDLIAEIEGRRPALFFERWRPGDQRYYVSDCRAFQAITGWSPRVSAGEGVRELHRWLAEIPNAEPRPTAGGPAGAEPRPGWEGISR
jgi:CDP-paratose 2-epimerase